MSAPEIIPPKPIKKPNLAVIFITLVAAMWLTSVALSFAGRMMTSATDIGPFAGMLLYAVVATGWVTGLIRIGRNLYNFYSSQS